MELEVALERVGLDQNRKYVVYFQHIEFKFKVTFFLSLAEGLIRSLKYAEYKSYAIECVTQIIFIIMVCVCDR